MKNNVVQHAEVMESLSGCFRQLVDTKITDKNIGHIINRGKAAAALVTTMHREILFQVKRDQTKGQLKIAAKRGRPRKGD